MRPKTRRRTTAMSELPAIDFATARYVEMPMTQYREPTREEKRFREKAKAAIERMRRQGRLPRRSHAE